MEIDFTLNVLFIVFTPVNPPDFGNEKWQDSA